MCNTQPWRQPARRGNRFKKARLLADGFNQGYREPLMTREQTRCQRYAREATAGAEVGDLAVTVGNQALDMRSRDK